MKQDRYFKYLVAIVVLGLLTALGRASQHTEPSDRISSNAHVPTAGP